MKEMSKPKFEGSSRNASREKGGSEHDEAQDSNNSDSEVNLQSYLLSEDKHKKYAVITEGFLKTSFDIRRRSFDVNYSGSTVVTTMITGNKLLCSNVGDSRAILGSLKPRNTKLLPAETLATHNSHE